MIPLLYWAIGVILESVWWVSQKKALSASVNLPNTLFKLYAHLIGTILFISLTFFFSFQSDILNNKIILFYIFLISFFTISYQNFELMILKKEKLSTLMPYENVDKIFVVIFWYFLYQWTNNEVSLTTMLIVCFTFLVVLLFSIDFKTLKFPISVLHFIIAKIIKWILILSSGYILLKYTSITFWLIQVVSTVLISIILSYLLRNSFKILLKQTKVFYKHRFFAVITWQIAFVLWLYIMESSGVIIASLLWFLAVISKTLSIKFILKENPTKKQIILALLVVLLIGLWFYFK